MRVIAGDELCKEWLWLGNFHNGEEQDGVVYCQSLEENFKKEIFAEHNKVSKLFVCH